MTATLKSRYQAALERAILDKAAKKRAKAERRGRQPFIKVYLQQDLEVLTSHGWKVHTFTPLSYGAPQSWLLIPE